jgi:ABC-type xylose transport system permease subunit
MTEIRKAIPIGDLIFAGFMIVLSIAYIIASFSMPPPALEPVGPAAFPRWVSAIQIVLALIVIWRALTRERQPAEQTDYRKRYDLAIVTVLLVIAYFGVLQFEWLTFQWATAGFVFFLTAFLFDWKISKLPVVIILALILGLGLKFTFTEILYLDLP